MTTPPNAHAQPTPRIGYVLKVFPRISETFVINEIRALEILGDTLCVLSLHHPEVPAPHRILEEIESPVFYVEDSASPGDDAVLEARRYLERRLMVGPDLRAGLLPRKYVQLAIRLAEMVRAQKIDHLHAHFASRAGHVAALAAGLSGRSYSLTAHAKDIYHADVDPRLLSWQIAHARFAVTVSDYNRRYLQTLVAAIPGAAEKIVRIYNGVDLARFHAAQRAPDASPLVLSVGRLVEKKGFAVLLEACRLLRARGADFGCEIIGGGPEEEALRHQIAAAGLRDTVTLRGVLATEDVGRALQNATVVVLPCVVARDGNVDALPTVLLEAMAAALPVVSTRLSGIPEIVIDGETGLLVPPGDAAALADALGVILDQPTRAQAMGRAGRRRAERLFDLSTNVGDLRHLLRGQAGR
jgi:glycosyltransferase involved in cell wall biosynthesis